MRESFLLPHPSLTVSYKRIFIILITYCITLSDQTTYNYKVMEIVDDFPSEDNFETYLSALKAIVYFVHGHKYYVDIDLCLGLYLINGYLRNIILTKGEYLTRERKDIIVQLIKTNNDNMHHFITISKNQNDKKEIPDVLVNMLNMQGNQITWPYLTQKFNTELLNKTKFYSRKKLEEAYFKWSKYTKIVYDYKHGYSTLGNCLNLLAQNPPNNHTELLFCQVPYECLEYAVKGDEFGYQVAHRTLFLLMARYWRNCLITAEDKEMIDKFCAKMYNELEYIAYHDFELPDIFMGHITLCTFEGHAQFLRRSWIEELLEFQTRFGCFNLTRPNAGSALLVAIFRNISEKADQMVWEESCNAHTTGVAGVTLAAGIGFILEITANRESTNAEYETTSTTNYP